MSEETKPEQVEKKHATRTFEFEVIGIGTDPARLGRFVEEVTTRAVEERIDVTDLSVGRSKVAFTCQLRDAWRVAVYEGDLDEEELAKRWSWIQRALADITCGSAEASRYGEPPLGEGPHIVVSYFDGGGWNPRRRSILVSPETYARWEALLAEHGGLKVHVRAPMNRLMDQFSAILMTTETHNDGHFFAAAVDHRMPHRGMPLSEQIGLALGALTQKALMRVEAGSEPTP